MSSTEGLVRQELTKTYGDNAMTRALVVQLTEKIDKWPNKGPRYGAEHLEDMIRLTCWDWFSGGTTAKGVARRLTAALEGR